MTTPKCVGFADVAHLARRRLAQSAARNDPQAWAYWMMTAKWAAEMSTWCKGQDTAGAALILRDARAALVTLPAQGRYREAADIYSRMKWCVSILRANGKKVRLSLEWLRNWPVPA